jgi:hypothetical protein
MYRGFLHATVIMAAMLATPLQYAVAQQGIPERRRCQLLIGERQTLVRAVYRVDLVMGKQKIFFADIPSEADLASLQIHDRRVKLSLLQYERPRAVSQDCFQKKKGGAVAWSRSAGMPNDSGLRELPGMSCILHSPVRGTRDIEVTYTMHGLSWYAHYQLTARGDIRTSGGKTFAVDLSGTVVVSNTSACSFDNAEISVSGTDNRLLAPRRKEPGFLTLADSPLADLWYPRPRHPAPENDYPLKGSHSLPAKGHAAIPLPAVMRIPAQRYFAVASDDFSVLSKGRGIPLDEIIRFDNSRANGLGLSLPPGRVTVARAGALRYQVAVAQMKHARPDDQISINLGPNRGILAYRSQRGRTELRERSYREFYEINLISRLDYPVDILISEEPPTVLKWEMISADVSYVREGRMLEMTLQLGPMESRTVAYSIEVQQPLL